jgi:hypothetical protein
VNRADSVVEWLKDAQVLTPWHDTGEPWSVPTSTHSCRMLISGIEWAPAIRFVWGDSRRLVRREDVPDILPAFVRLSSAPASQCLRFAQRYGPLWLSSQVLPVGARGSEDDPTETELIPWYRYYGRFAAAIIRTSHLLREATPRGGALLYTEDVRVIRDVWKMLRERSAPARKNHPAFPFGLLPIWDEVAGGTAEKKRVPFETSKDQINLRYLVAGPVNWWLDSSLARPFVAWREGYWITLMAPGNAWGAIGRAMAGRITRDSNLKYCAHCGRPVFRSRLRVGAVACNTMQCHRAVETEKRRRRRERERESRRRR